MKRILGTIGVLLVTIASVQAQTKPTKTPQKHVAAIASKKNVDTVSKKGVVVVKKEEKKAVVHKHTHQAKVVKS